jgi:hypothetical protein
MAKEHKSIKATKKKAAMSPKEKKAAKKASLTLIGPVPVT